MTCSALRSSATSPADSMTAPAEPSPAARALLERLRAFGLPAGAELARTLHGVKLTWRGELRSTPRTRWIPFTAEETIDATRSGYRWDARLRTGPLGSVTITDLYENGHGRASVRLGGLLPVASGSGPDYDRAELQRYLAEIVLCPAILLTHPSLEWTAVGPGTLRVRDTADSTGATVDLDLDYVGRPVACRADRPRTVGTRLIVTSWSASYAAPLVCEGLQVPSHLEAAWHLPEGPFTYVRAELLALVAMR